MDVTGYCVAIYRLLSGVGEINWSKVFKNLIAELEIAENQSVYRNILNVYAGMGSFNDLVLYRDGKICMEENNELDRLRTGLYNAIAQQWS